MEYVAEPMSNTAPRTLDASMSSSSTPASTTAAGRGNPASRTDPPGRRAATARRGSARRAARRMPKPSPLPAQNRSPVLISCTTPATTSPMVGTGTGGTAAMLTQADSKPAAAGRVPSIGSTIEHELGLGRALQAAVFGVVGPARQLASPCTPPGSVSAVSSISKVTSPPTATPAWARRRAAPGRAARPRAGRAESVSGGVVARSSQPMGAGAHAAAIDASTAAALAAGTPSVRCGGALYLHGHGARRRAGLATKRAAQPDKIAYRGKGNIYLNITNRCSCDCGFCLRTFTDEVFGSDWCSPASRRSEEISARSSSPASTDPPTRSSSVASASPHAPRRGHGGQRVADTCAACARASSPTATANSLNPDAEVVAVLARAGLTAATVSLNAADPETYDLLCRPIFCKAPGLSSALPKNACGTASTPRSRPSTCPRPTSTAARRIAQDIGAAFRVRGLVPPPRRAHASAAGREGA